MENIDVDETAKCSDNADLLVKTNGALQSVTLNRPTKLNALNIVMIRTLTPLLKKWERDSCTKVVVLKGAGNKAFCSGGDLKGLYKTGDFGQHFFNEEFTLNHIIGCYRKPLVPLCDGITFGGAGGLSVVSKLCVCSENAVFCMPECAIGFLTDVGSGYFLSRLPSSLGIFLGLTAHRLRGKDIAISGLASHFILSKYFPKLEAEFALLDDNSSETVISILDKYKKLSCQDREYRGEHLSFADHLSQISACFSARTVEEIVTRLEQDATPWAHEQIAHMRKMSPTSLKICLKLLQDGVSRTLGETLVVEYRLSQRCLADHDFMEGIRSVIIDKDFKPQWQPHTLDLVSEERVDFYFSPLEDGLELQLEDVDSIS